MQFSIAISKVISWNAYGPRSFHCSPCSSWFTSTVSLPFAWRIVYGAALVRELKTVHQA